MEEKRKSYIGDYNKVNEGSLLAETQTKDNVAERAHKKALNRRVL